MGSRIGTVGDSLAFASYLGACRSLWCLGRGGLKSAVIELEAMLVVAALLVLGWNAWGCT